LFHIDVVTARANRKDIALEQPHSLQNEEPPEVAMRNASNRYRSS
jgi:hypothetical protein